MSNQKGVQSIKTVGELVIDFTAQSIQSFNDGFQATDLADFVDEGLKAATNADAFKQIGAEVKDGISPSEAVELHGHLKNYFVQKNLGIKNEALVDSLVASITDAALYNAKVFYAAKELVAAGKGIDVSEL